MIKQGVTQIYDAAYIVFVAINKKFDVHCSEITANTFMSVHLDITGGVDCATLNYINCVTFISHVFKIH